MMNVIRTLLKQQHEHEINDNGKVNKDYKVHTLCVVERKVFRCWDQLKKFKSIIKLENKRMSWDWIFLAIKKYIYYFKA